MDAEPPDRVTELPPSPCDSRILAFGIFNGKIVSTHFLSGAVETQPKYLRANDRRLATVEAVVTLAANHNPSEITTTAIAQEMGLTQGAVFRHFATKDTILQAVMKWVTAGLMSRLDNAIKKTSSPILALEALFLAHVEFVAAHPGVPRILLSELQRSEASTPKRIVQAFLRRYGERVSQLLTDAKERGELHAELDTEAAAILFVGTIQGLVLQGLLAGDVTRIRQDAPRVFAIYRRGIKAAPAEAAVEEAAVAAATPAAAAPAESGPSGAASNEAAS